MGKTVLNKIYYSLAKPDRESENYSNESYVCKAQ